MSDKKSKNMYTDMDEKSASIYIELNADSGYKSRDHGRVSANQWGMISNILHAGLKDVYALLAFKLQIVEIEGEPGVYQRNSDGQRFLLTETGFQLI